MSYKNITSLSEYQCMSYYQRKNITCLITIGISANVLLPEKRHHMSYYHRNISASLYQRKHITCLITRGISAHVLLPEKKQHISYNQINKHETFACGSVHTNCFHGYLQNIAYDMYDHLPNCLIIQFLTAKSTTI